MPEKLFEFITLEGLEAFKEESEAKSGSAYASKMMISQNADTGVVTFKLYSSDNTLLDTKTLDLDTEHIIKSVSLNYAQKKLIFTMNDDSTIECDISDLIDGLKSEVQDVADDLADEISRAERAENLKADKVVNGTENNIVLLDANGNIKDSGKSLADTGKIDSVSIDGTTIQPDANKNVDLPAYPTRVSLAINNVDNTSDSAKPVSTAQQTAIDATGHKIDLEINSTNFKMVAKLYDKNNTLLSTSSEIDLPLESVVVNGAYDSQTKKVILTLQNGSTIEFSVADLINGLQTTIDAQHKLSSDLVDDAGNTNKFVTQSEKTLWNSKVNAYEVANITALTTAQVNTLKVGDVVVKNENGNKHTYVVTYKEDEVGICLTYADAENVETVSYDYLNNEWVYNSTDITKIVVELSREERFTNNWVNKTWQGLEINNRSDANVTPFWNDGNNIYFSNVSDQYYLDGNEWKPKTWSGLTSFRGGYIWSDENNIYYSNGSDQYYLDGNEWKPKTWSGLTSFDGRYIWTDGENIYYSDGTTQKQLVNGEWVNKSWSGLAYFTGHLIWTDGENIYYSDGTTQKQLVNGAWIDKSWSGLSNFAGGAIWTDGENIYYTGWGGSANYILDKATSTWNTKTWTGGVVRNALFIWKANNNIFYTQFPSGSGTIDPANIINLQLQKEVIVNKADIEDVQAEINSIKDGETLDSFADVEEALENIGGGVEVVELSTATGTLTQEQYDKLSQDVSAIKYDGKVFYKESSTSSEMKFHCQIKIFSGIDTTGNLGANDFVNGKYYVALDPTSLSQNNEYDFIGVSTASSYISNFRRGYYIREIPNELETAVTCSLAYFNQTYNPVTPFVEIENVISSYITITISTLAYAYSEETVNIYSKAQTDTLLDGKANANDVYTKTATDTLLNAKANADDVYSKTATDTLLNAKLDKPSGTFSTITGITTSTSRITLNSSISNGIYEIYIATDSVTINTFLIAINDGGYAVATDDVESKCFLVNILENLIYCYTLDAGTKSLFENGENVILYYKKLF